MLGKGNQPDKSACVWILLFVGKKEGNQIGPSLLPTDGVGHSSKPLTCRQPKPRPLTRWTSFATVFAAPRTMAIFVITLERVPALLPEVLALTHRRIRWC